jgi:phage/plasmid-like protein (TIGR03299 family)
MSHEITIRENGFAETAFAGETPWHGLGQEINPDATIEEWQVNAGMDWEVVSAPVRYEAHIQKEQFEMQEFTGQNVLYRSDTKAPLSVVSNRYHPVQPRDVLEFFRELVDVAGFKIQVAGTLAGGKRMWAIAETGTMGEVVKNDAVGGFLLLSTSCDRTLATTARFTSIRVVCNNTLQMAMQDKRHLVSLSHLSKFDPQDMQMRLAGAVSTFGSFMEMAQVLQKQKMSQAQAKKFLERLIAPWNQVKRDEAKLEDNRQFKKILSLFEGEAKGQEMVGFTKWGMLNAVTEYYDHHAQSRTDDARLDSAWFGRGDRIKNQAMELLLA